jgi:hypothetical protein
MTNLRPIKWKKTAEIISSKVRNKTREFTLPILIQYSTEIPSQSSKAWERKKSDSNQKGTSQTIPIFRWYDPVLKEPQRLQQQQQKP